MDLFCNVSVCVCVCVGFVKRGCTGNMCTCIYCVLYCLFYVVCVASFMYIYSYLFCLYWCKGLLPPSDKSLAVNNKNNNNKSLGTRIPDYMASSPRRQGPPALSLVHL
jgi:hypothetical protein